MKQATWRLLLATAAGAATLFATCGGDPEPTLTDPPAATEPATDEPEPDTTTEPADIEPAVSAPTTVGTDTTAAATVPAVGPTDTTTATVAPDDTEPDPTTTVPVVVGEAPAFLDAAAPTVAWRSPTERELLTAWDVWLKIETFWTDYMTEGHSEKGSFDAHTRKGLSETAAGQINYVHRRFWSERLPVWDRVWNEAFAKEREQQREWVMLLSSFPYVYNNPNLGRHARYWGPTGTPSFTEDGEDIEAEDRVSDLIPLIDLTELEAWLTEHGYDLDQLRKGTGDWRRILPTSLLNVLLGSSLSDLEIGSQPTDEEAAAASRASPPFPSLDPSLTVWQGWAEQHVGEIEALGPQAAGGKLGPEPGEMWYQWYPEYGSDGNRFDPYPALGDDPFGRIPDGWWPDRLDIPVHDGEQYRVFGTVGPADPTNGHRWFEVCLWASGGLFAAWSLPHPDIEDASANTTWWLTGQADQQGTILEISEPVNRPCLITTLRDLYEKEWPTRWNHWTKRARERTVYDQKEDAPWGQRPDHWHGAYLRMEARAGLGSWLWREHPNPGGDADRLLGWEPARVYTDHPDTIGMMIHPMYMWDPAGEPGGYPAAGRDSPWKWVPLRPGRDIYDDGKRHWQISLGGCQSSDEPYLWAKRGTIGTAYSGGLTTDGGPVWAWPGVIEYSPDDLFETAYAAYIKQYGDYRVLPPYADWLHTLDGVYYPPVPCDDIDDGKYEPEQITNHMIPAAFDEWSTAVGTGPPPDWTNPKPYTW